MHQGNSRRTRTRANQAGCEPSVHAQGAHPRNARCFPRASTAKKLPRCRPSLPHDLVAQQQAPDDVPPGPPHPAAPRKLALVVLARQRALAQRSIRVSPPQQAVHAQRVLPRRGVQHLGERRDGFRVPSRCERFAARCQELLHKDGFSSAQGWQLCSLRMHMYQCIVALRSCDGLFWWLPQRKHLPGCSCEAFYRHTATVSLLGGLFLCAMRVRGGAMRH